MRDVLEVGLRYHGFNVRLAPDAAAALDALERQRIDVILLDVMLPRIDGLTLVPMLRRLTEIPIVMLSAKASVADRIAALDAGADDYVVKPFDFGELSARLRSALRRPALGEVVQIGYADLSIDLTAHRVERGGEEIALSAREFALLAVLARSPQRVFTRAQLIELAWDGPHVVGTATVESFISFLRAKVDAPPRRRLIHTVRGVGYTLR